MNIFKLFREDDKKCNCNKIGDLTLERDEISKRIKGSKKIAKTLIPLAKHSDQTTLHSCNICGQYWQHSLAWNWNGKSFFFKVPKTTVNEWQTEKYVSPSDLIIYNSLMKDYFSKNNLTDSNNPCKKESCSNKALNQNVLCRIHFIKNLQNMSMLPQTPEGKYFEPYKE